MVEIPHTELGAETLDRLIEEFVTRDGTEATDMPAKVGQVRRMLEKGKVVIVYDEEEETVTIVSREEWGRMSGGR